MPAYLMAFIDVTDPAQYAEYTKATPAVIAQFGGRFIVRGGRKETLEGPPEQRRVVVIESPSFEQAQTFFHSEEYQQVRELRLEASTATLILVDGFSPPGAA